MEDAPFSTPEKTSWGQIKETRKAHQKTTWGQIKGAHALHTLYVCNLAFESSW